MALRLHHHSFQLLSSSNCWLSKDQRGSAIGGIQVLNLNYQLLSDLGCSRKGWVMHHALLWNTDHGLVGYREYYLKFSKSPRRVNNLAFASASDDDDDDDVFVKGSPEASTSTDLEKMRVKLNSSQEDVDFYDGLLQSLYDAARVFELAVKEHNSLSKVSWFSKAWLGGDQNAWVKELSYQAAVYSLLQAANEISSQICGRDKNANVFVQRSFLRLSASLESSIREKLSTKQPEAYEWFWSNQVPAVVTSFVNKFVGEKRITATSTFSSLSAKTISLDLKSPSNISVLMLALTCIAIITKLGSTKVSCSQFFSMSTEITGNLMGMMVDLISMSHAYDCVKYVGLHREFLVHFGPQAAACGVKVEQGSEEVVFWVNILQRQLQQAIDKERICSRLSTSESREVLEKDLAIFGFFVALGRSTRFFLSANGFNTLDDPVEDFIRYLIGGSVLYYPQLSSISSYQFYVEVVCEELDWLPFYPRAVNTTKQVHVHKNKLEGSPNAEAVPEALDVCSHWIENFIKYSTWLESPSNVKAAKFLSIGHKKLVECIEEFRLIKGKTLEVNTKETVERQRSTVHSSDSTAKVSDSFDEALKNVEESMLRLENLLQELSVSRSSSGKEHLKAICSDSLQQENYSELSTPNEGITVLESRAINRFEHLRNELTVLERRVQRRAYILENDEDLVIMDKVSRLIDDDAGVVQMVQKKGHIIEKSWCNLKETVIDIWQGTQLLTIDAAASMALLRRDLRGDRLTKKEKETLKRTLTDMASVIPIGILMLLPVTAVGHAAMLAAIKKYVPALIPSTYTPERLDLFRQHEKMKQMTIDDVQSDEEVDKEN